MCGTFAQIAASVKSVSNTRHLQVVRASVNLDTVTPGEVIRAERLRRGWTQKDLASRVGNIDHSGVSNIERGKTGLGLARAERFARVLEISPARLRSPQAEPATAGTILHRLRDIEGKVDHLLTGVGDVLVLLGANRRKSVRDAPGATRR